jgi:hypothetical protein
MPRASLFQLGVGRVVRDELGVHIQLADAAGDQLGQLAPEVEDDDGTRFDGGGSGNGRAVRRGGVERRLEIGLDLGVVGGEHAVPCIGRLAVDGLAPLRRGRWGV